MSSQPLPANTEAAILARVIEADPNIITWTWLGICSGCVFPLRTRNG